MTLPQSFKISPEESHAFARISGDFNPLHLDPVFARRLSLGGTVVHGMHACLCLLDAILADREGKTTLLSLKVQFSQPIRQNQEIIATRRSSSQGEKWLLTSQEQRALSMTVAWSEALPGPDDVPPQETLPPEQPAQEHFFQETTTLAGRLPLFLDSIHTPRCFSHLTQLPPGQVAFLLATTRLIGMEYPGLHSIFSGFQLEFAPPGAEEPPVLHYRVLETDRRFSGVTLAVEGLGVRGNLEAFFRPSSCTQAAFATVQSHLEAGLFAGQKGWIVGGSRGLGEVAAKILSAGGGQSLISYQSGREDALRVVEEIRGGGGHCDAFHFDVLAPTMDDDHFSPPVGITQLYYFATPPIEFREWSGWQEALFQRYLRYYVTGFEKTVQLALRFRGAHGPLTIFYPSTIFLEQLEPGANEYAAAKAAGESVCRYLNGFSADVRCVFPRLGRLRTDQTSAILHVKETGDPFQELLPLLKGMNMAGSLP